jgi:hypothetical protein
MSSQKFNIITRLLQYNLLLDYSPIIFFEENLASLNFRVDEERSRSHSRTSIVGEDEKTGINAEPVR